MPDNKPKDNEKPIHTAPTDRTPINAIEPETMTPMPVRPEAKIEDQNTEEDLEEDLDEDDEEEPEPQIIREVIIKEKRVGGGGCFGFIRQLACLGCLLFLVLIILSVVIVVFKPPFLTEPLKTLVNGKYNNFEMSQEQPESTPMESYIESILEGKEGDISFQISEVQISSALDLGDQPSKMKVDIEEGKIVVLNNIAKQGKPLWLVTEATDKGDKLELTYFGLGRINTPSIIRVSLVEKIFGKLGGINKSLKVNSAEELANVIIGNYLGVDVIVKEVKFERDVILVTVSL